MHHLINDDTLCAGPKYAFGYQGACFDDFGGPLASNGQLIGVLSSVKKCGTKPDIFIRISTYIDWIRKVSGVNAV